jgi:putative FmdB family regulatory protein
MWEMPLYEYDCLKCGRRFEVLVRGPEAVACPSCGHAELERVISAFAVSSDGIREANIASARKRNLSLEREKQRTQIDHLHDHDH